MPVVAHEQVAVVVHVVVAVDLADVVFGEVLEDAGHVHVLLHRGAVQPHPQVFGESLHLIPKGTNEA